jgi:hypothetical protein
VDLVGLPCDQRRWSCDEVKGSAGSKFVFDLAFGGCVAEPRLALLKFAVLRGGVQVVDARVCVCVCGGELLQVSRIVGVFVRT